MPGSSDRDICSRKHIGIIGPVMFDIAQTQSDRVCRDGHMFANAPKGPPTLGQDTFYDR